MTMKNNAKFEEELTFHFKTDMRNLTSLDPTTQKSKKMLFNLLFNCPRKLLSQVVFFNVQYIYFQAMMATLRINVRIFWSHMKNFQVKHDQCDSIIFLKTFTLESSK